MKSSILDFRLDYEYASVYKQLQCNAEDVLPATLLKKKTPTRVFSYKFGEMNVFFTEHLRSTASV